MMFTHVYGLKEYLDDAAWALQSTPPACQIEQLISNNRCVLSPIRPAKECFNLANIRSDVIRQDLVRRDLLKNPDGFLHLVTFLQKVLRHRQLAERTPARRRVQQEARQENTEQDYRSEPTRIPGSRRRTTGISLLRSCGSLSHQRVNNRICQLPDINARACLLARRQSRTVFGSDRARLRLDIGGAEGRDERSRRARELFMSHRLLERVRRILPRVRRGEALQRIPRLVVDLRFDVRRNLRQGLLQRTPALVAH
mmetsp:Transcript_11975/g.31699  ORF Transcript_11975/g.31699 Transcript_11975/m.31699 type:complete len:255 (-) Transcript_11975:242-1006(-)